ncbi:hypothetical protein EsH8_X_000050 [Colletotrichum jinshuiense]
MKFITLAALTAVASAAPSVEPRSTFTQWFSDAVAQPEAFKPNNLTFSFGLSFTDVLNSIISDMDTDFAANTSCSGTDVTATVGFPSGLTGIQNWSPFVYIPQIDTTYTANISTENPIYTCGHIGTPGIGAKCFDLAGTFTATTVQNLSRPL